MDVFSAQVSGGLRMEDLSPLFVVVRSVVRSRCQWTVTQCIFTSG